MLRIRVEGLGAWHVAGFGVEGLGFRVYGSGLIDFRVQGSGSRFWVQFYKSPGFRV